MVSNSYLNFWFTIQFAKIQRQWPKAIIFDEVVLPIEGFLKFTVSYASVPIP